ncbi:hypothetical protein I314_01679 [Cryptococcus bacillisporus CA1873]|uniref:Uncharacterized protein n=2 Tax=Cryptococcus gattii TaxID=552467 RepID=A0A0D0VRV7_CRYGA|nr:hypothetical protein I312_01322 [Cryptococcus bacillisporus CA1280]KIR68185.1 hypothetical protein I314_01679 [Cryptococcus bacillisporus CA1873]|eukprot:KIR68185.1 hypothetical protein I314_01679 [Cryptococcus gattii CA1873]
MVTRSYTCYAFIKRISSVTCAITTPTTKSIKWLNDTTLLVYRAFSVKAHPISTLTAGGCRGRQPPLAFLPPKSHRNVMPQIPND